MPRHFPAAHEKVKERDAYSLSGPSVPSRADGATPQPASASDIEIPPSNSCVSNSAADGENFDKLDVLSNSGGQRQTDAVNDSNDNDNVSGSSYHLTAVRPRLSGPLTTGPCPGQFWRVSQVWHVGARRNTSVKLVGVVLSKLSYGRLPLETLRS